MRNLSLKNSLPSLKDLAFIVLNYNCWKDTVRCVQRLQILSAECRIVIVDNQSTDRSMKEIEAAGLLQENVRLIKTDRNGGYSYGNNIGIRCAIDTFSSETIAIINPDVLLPSLDMVQQLLCQLWSDSSFAMIGGNPIENGYYKPAGAAWQIPNHWQVFAERLLLTMKDRSSPNLKMISEDLAQVDCLAGCFFMIKTAIFQELNFFDEGVFLYNEETILGIKVRQAGYQAVLSVKSFYAHQHDYTKENRQQSLAKKIARLKLRYQSRKYLIQQYYPSYLTIGLFLVESINFCQIAAGHIKHQLAAKDHSISKGRDFEEKS